MKYFCSKCGHRKPLADFYPSKATSRPHDWCKMCDYWRKRKRKANADAVPEPELSPEDREYEDALDQAVNFINAQAGR